MKTINTTTSRRKCQWGEVIFVKVMAASEAEYREMVEKLAKEADLPVLISFTKGTPAWATIRNSARGMAFHDAEDDSIFWADSSSPFVRGELMLWEDEAAN